MRLLSPGMKAVMMIVAGFALLMSPAMILLFPKISDYPTTFSLVFQGTMIVGLALSLTGAINIVIFVVRSLRQSAGNRRA